VRPKGPAWNVRGVPPAWHGRLAVATIIGE